MLDRSKPGLRVNVGCGPTPTSGWLNLDNSPSVYLGYLPWIWPFLPPSKKQWAQAAKANNIRLGTATRLRLRDGSVEALYSSHMMEHLDKREAEAFLRESFRVLAPGGVIRLALPDLKLIAREYLASGDAERFMEASFLGLNRPRRFYEWLVYVVMGPRHHLWMYDGDSLKKLLAKFGFVDVKVLKPGETMIPDPGPLDLREREEESVYVEAMRPG